MFKIVLDHTPFGKTLSCWCRTIRHHTGPRAGLVRKFASIEAAEKYLLARRRFHRLVRRAFILPCGVDNERLDWDENVWQTIRSVVI